MANAAVMLPAEDLVSTFYLAQSLYVTRIPKLILSIGVACSFGVLCQR